MSILISENLKFHNTITCALRDAKTNEIIRMEKINNVVTNTGKQLTLDALGGVTSGSFITYGAVGTGAGSTSAGTILLAIELTRNPNTYARAGQTGTFSVFFTTTQANGLISEVGFFGGINATTTINTGIMFDRILLASSINKTTNFTLTIDLDVGF